MDCLKFILLTIFYLSISSLFSQDPGDLDPDFGSNGLVISSYENFGAMETFIEVLVQRDGKIVNVGSTGTGTGSMLINRLNLDGSLDTSFGDGGSRIITLPGNFPSVLGANLQSDDKILTTGRTSNRLYIARFTVDGDLDMTFGDEGIMFQEFEDAAGQGRDLLVQDDGRIVVVGAFIEDFDHAFLVARYMSDGSLDTSFADNGMFIYDQGAWTQSFYCVALQADNKILCGGVSGSGDRSVLMRLEPDGMRDSTFGVDGFVEIELSGGDDEFYDLNLYDDGKILATGDVVNTSSSHTDFSLVRLLPDGSRDSTFGVNGIVQTDVGAYSGGLRGAEILEDGKIITAGFVVNIGVGRDLTLVKYLPDGSLDNSFSDNGIVHTDVNGKDDFFFGMAIQPDGKILGVGRVEGEFGNSFNLVTARYIGTDIPGLYFETNVDFDSLCASSSNIEVEVSLASIAGFSEEVTLTLEGLPDGVETMFSPANVAELDPNSLVTLSLNFENVSTGVYPISVIASTSSITKSKVITIDLSGGIPETATLISPQDISVFENGEIDLYWNPVSDIYNYNLELATNPAFGTSTIINESLSQDSFSVFEALAPGLYYWRVKSVNRCGESNYSEVRAFQVAFLGCPRYETTDVNLPIPDLQSDTTTTVISTITLNNIENILDFNIHLDIDHEFIGDLKASIVSPQGIELVLFDRPGYPEQNFGCSMEIGPITFDDEAILTGEDLNEGCFFLPIFEPLSGSYQTLEGSLFDLIQQGVEGTWTLKVSDLEPVIAGSITNWYLEICTEPGPVVPIIIENNILSNISNGGTVLLSTNEILATCEISSPQDLKYIIRALPQNGSLSLNSAMINLGDQFTQKQIDDNQLSYTHDGSPMLIDSFKFDVINQLDTWLPNQYFHVTINAAPLFASAVVGNELSCFGDVDGEIIVNANGGIPPYQYSLDSEIFQESPIFSNLSVGIYEIIIRDSESEIFITNSVTILEPDQLISDITVNESSASILVSGGTTPYSYSIDGQSFQTESTFNNLENGFYSIMIEDANGCVSVDSFEITFITAPLTANVVIENELLCFGNTDAQIMVIVNGGFPPYEYSLNDGAYQSENSFSNLSVGMYQIVIRDSNGELFTPNELTISEPDLLTSNIELDGNTATILASGGTMPYSYSIDGQNFQTTSIFNNLENGTYTVIIQDVNECSTSDSFEIMIVSTNQINDKKGLTLSPNPTTQHINLKWESTFQGQFDIVIFNSSGQTIFTKKYNKNSSLFDTQIDLIDLSNGIYFVELRSNGESIMQRVVLLKD